MCGQLAASFPHAIEQCQMSGWTDNFKIAFITTTGKIAASTGNALGNSSRLFAECISGAQCETIKEIELNMRAKLTKNLFKQKLSNNKICHMFTAHFPLQRHGRSGKGRVNVGVRGGESVCGLVQLFRFMFSPQSGAKVYQQFNKFR